MFTDHTGVIWNMKATTRYSAWLNRTIRKAGVAKIGAIAVHPDALNLWDQGGTLWQENRTKRPEALIRN
jgi:hypothetical protein